MKLAEQLLKKCCFLAGPTAVGKTQISLQIAERLDAEIISLDSMAIYRGMDIGTAKPDAEERRRIPHHMIDIADPHQEFTVARFVQMASAAAQQVIERGRTPLFVGGTGLYLRSMLRGLFEGPEADWEFRNQLQSEATHHGSGWLHRLLSEIDPPTAARLHPNDTRRIVRAIEVHRLTGRRLSDDQTQSPLQQDQLPEFVVWLCPSRDQLYGRIERRVDQMMADGLLEETRQLIRRDPAPGRTALQALGYRELIAFLHGQCTLDAAVAQIKLGTRQFAKRQHTWFRNLPECSMLSVADDEPPDSLVHRILDERNTRQR